ncbi:MAG: branched-chain amino acid transport system ATP-binding protein [Acidimicrobiaceae bacterium]|nr:branched-chain amino acid transport system ATP-binding protein [Acidimicrobiaceae bacterium]
MTALLNANKVTVRFGGVTAVDEVSFAIEPGRLYGIVGPNGSGKTTLLNALSRLQQLSSGEIAIDGQDVSNRGAAEAARLGVARTFQAIRLSASLTVKENVMVGADLVSGRAGVLARWLLLPGARRAEQSSGRVADEMLDRVGLLHAAKEYPSALPYGHQRRVEIARALATNPRLLLLDEPTAGMNRSERDEIAKLMTQLRDDGMAQILVEHDLRMMMTVCEHLFMMNFGQLITEGDPREVANDPRVREAYLGHGRRGAA